MRIVGNVAGIRGVLYKIRPPGPELWILDLAILRFEPEISINGDKLCVDPPYERVNNFFPTFKQRLSLVGTAYAVPIIWKISPRVRAGRTFDRK